MGLRHSVTTTKTRPAGTKQATATTTTPPQAKFQTTPKATSVPRRPRRHVASGRQESTTNARSSPITSSRPQQQQQQHGVVASATQHNKSTRSRFAPTSRRKTKVRAPAAAEKSLISALDRKVQKLVNRHHQPTSSSNGVGVGAVENPVAGCNLHRKHNNASQQCQHHKAMHQQQQQQQLLGDWSTLSSEQLEQQLDERLVVASGRQVTVATAIPKALKHTKELQLRRRRDTAETIAASDVFIYPPNYRDMSECHKCARDNKICDCIIIEPPTIEPHESGDELESHGQDFDSRLETTTATAAAAAATKTADLANQQDDNRAPGIAYESSSARMRTNNAIAVNEEATATPMSAGGGNLNANNNDARLAADDDDDDAASPGAADKLIRNRSCHSYHYRDSYAREPDDQLAPQCQLKRVYRISIANLASVNQKHNEQHQLVRAMQPTTKPPPQESSLDITRRRGGTSLALPSDNCASQADQQPATSLLRRRRLGKSKSNNNENTQPPTTRSLPPEVVMAHTTNVGLSHQDDKQAARAQAYCCNESRAKATTPQKKISNQIPLRRNLSSSQHKREIVDDVKRHEDGAFHALVFQQDLDNYHKNDEEDGGYNVACWRSRALTVPFSMQVSASFSKSPPPPPPPLQPQPQPQPPHPQPSTKKSTNWFYRRENSKIVTTTRREISTSMAFDQLQQSTEQTKTTRKEIIQQKSLSFESITSGAAGGPRCRLEVSNQQRKLLNNRDQNCQQQRHSPPPPTITTNYPQDETFTSTERAGPGQSSASTGLLGSSYQVAPSSSSSQTASMRRKYLKSRHNKQSALDVVEIEVEVPSAAAAAAAEAEVSRDQECWSVVTCDDQTLYRRADSNNNNINSIIRRRPILVDQLELDEEQIGNDDFGIGCETESHISGYSPILSSVRSYIENMNPELRLPTITNNSTQQQQPAHQMCINESVNCLSMAMGEAICAASQKVVPEVGLIDQQQQQQQHKINTNDGDIPSGEYLPSTDLLVQTTPVVTSRAIALPISCANSLDTALILASSSSSEASARGADCLETPKQSIFDGASKDEILEYLEDARERVPDILIAADEVMVISESELIVVNQLDLESPATPIAIVEAATNNDMASPTQETTTPNPTTATATATHRAMEADGGGDGGQVVCSPAEELSNELAEKLAHQGHDDDDLIEIFSTPKAALRLVGPNIVDSLDQQYSTKGQEFAVGSPSCVIGGGSGALDERSFLDSKSPDNDELLQSEIVDSSTAKFSTQETSSSQSNQSHGNHASRVASSPATSGVALIDYSTQQTQPQPQPQSQPPPPNSSSVDSRCNNNNNRQHCDLFSAQRRKSTSESCELRNRTKPEQVATDDDLQKMFLQQRYSNNGRSLASSASSSSASTSPSFAYPSTNTSQTSGNCSAASNFYASNSLSCSSPFIAINNQQPTPTTANYCISNSAALIYNGGSGGGNKQILLPSSFVGATNNNEQQQQPIVDRLDRPSSARNNAALDNVNSTMMLPAGNQFVAKKSITSEEENAADQQRLERLVKNKDHADELTTNVQHATTSPAGTTNRRQCTNEASGCDSVGQSNKSSTNVVVGLCKSDSDTSNRLSVIEEIQQQQQHDAVGSPKRGASPADQRAHMGLVVVQSEPEMIKISGQQQAKDKSGASIVTQPNSIQQTSISKTTTTQQQQHVAKTTFGPVTVATPTLPPPPPPPPPPPTSNQLISRPLHSHYATINRLNSYLADRANPESIVEFRCRDCDQLISVDHARIIDKTREIKLLRESDINLELSIGDKPMTFDQLERAYIVAMNGLPLCGLCDKRRKERKEIISEFVETELKYGCDLKIIHDEFYRPMQIAGLLNKEQINGIFLNLDELTMAHCRFARCLRDAINEATLINDTEYNTVNIGRLFVESADMLHTFESYCIRQGTAACLLARLTKERELLRIFLRVSQMENTLLRRMNLAAFLMVPVQRVTKYPLLLNRLYKVTPYHHKDREALRDAQLKVELHLEHINQQTSGGNVTATNKIWRRISNLSSTTPSNNSNYYNYNNVASNSRRGMINAEDIGYIKLRKAAMDLLKWDRDEIQFIHSGRIDFAPLNEYLTRQKMVKPNLRYISAHSLLIVQGKPNWKYRPDLVKPNLLPNSDHKLMAPTSGLGGTGIKEAALLLLREKNGRFIPFREPLFLSNCVLSTDCSQFNCDNTTLAQSSLQQQQQQQQNRDQSSANKSTSTSTSASNTNTNTNHHQQPQSSASTSIVASERRSLPGLASTSKLANCSNSIHDPSATNSAHQRNNPTSCATAKASSCNASSTFEFRAASAGSRQQMGAENFKMATTKSLSSKRSQDASETLSLEAELARGPVGVQMDSVSMTSLKSLPENSQSSFGGGGAGCGDGGSPSGQVVVGSNIGGAGAAPVQTPRSYSLASALLRASITTMSSSSSLNKSSSSTSASSNSTILNQLMTKVNIYHHHSSSKAHHQNEPRLVVATDAASSSCDINSSSVDSLSIVSKTMSSAQKTTTTKSNECGDGGDDDDGNNNYVNHSSLMDNNNNNCCTQSYNDLSNRQLPVETCGGGGDGNKSLFTLQQATHSATIAQQASKKLAAMGSSMGGGGGGGAGLPESSPKNQSYYNHHLFQIHHQPYGAYEESFEIHERTSKESLLLRADTPLKTRYWLQILRYHAKDLGQWRARRNGLANIMIMRQE